MAGDSPGYSLSLVAETTTGVLLSIERTAATRMITNGNNNNNINSSNGQPQQLTQGWVSGKFMGEFWLTLLN